MSDDPATPESVARSMEILRAVVATFEERVSLLLASDKPDLSELARASQTVKKIVGAARTFRQPERTSKKPPRGLGYGKDDALIVASLPWYKGNKNAAITAHYPEFTPEEVRTRAKRIREHGADIKAALGDDHPWETSLNWLGDLIEE